MRIEDICSPDNPVIRIPGDEETRKLVSYLGSREIGVVAEISRDVPPDGYGSIQIVIDDLIRFLRSKGIKTVFFGTGSSTIEATEKVAIAPSPSLKNGLFTDNAVQDAAYLVAMKWLAHYFNKGQLHLAHLHILYNSSPEYLDELGPTLWTLHWNASEEQAAQLTAKKVSAAGGGVVFISKSQMELYGEGISSLGVIYNPVDVTRIKPKFTPPSGEDRYLSFLGRCDPHKRPDLAARIAIAAGMRLKMRVQCLTREGSQYYQEVVHPIVSSPKGRELIDCQVKEIGHAEKIALFRGAFATLSPSTWDEPFGLIPVESMAAGTPPIVFDCGAAPELITSEVGCVISVKERMQRSDDWRAIEEEAVEEAASAIAEIVPGIDRRSCRKHVEENFSSEVVGRRHLLVYAKLLEHHL